MGIETLPDIETDLPRPLKKDNSFDGRAATWVAVCAAIPFALVILVAIIASIFGANDIKEQDHVSIKHESPKRRNIEYAPLEMNETPSPRAIDCGWKKC